MTEAERMLREIERLRDVIRRWGHVLVVEGRITLNDYRTAMFDYQDGVMVGDLRPDPMAEELARMHQKPFVET